MLLELPDELLGLVLEATENPMGLRLASKRFPSMPRGKAKVCELQRRALRTFGIKNCHRHENWLHSKSTAGAARAAATHLLYSLAHYSSSSSAAAGAALAAATWDPTKSEQRNAFIAFTPVEADKVRDHLVAQFPLLHRELTEGYLAWILEHGDNSEGYEVPYNLPKSSQKVLELKELREYVEIKMKVPTGTLTRAHYQLSVAVGKVVLHLNLIAEHKGSEDYPGHHAELLLAMTETFWLLPTNPWVGP